MMASESKNWKMIGDGGLTYVAPADVLPSFVSCKVEANQVIGRVVKGAAWSYNR